MYFSPHAWCFADGDSWGGVECAPRSSQVAALIGRGNRMRCDVGIGWVVGVVCFWSPRSAGEQAGASFGGNIMSQDENEDGGAR